MPGDDSDWLDVRRVVEEALDLPPELRRAHIEACASDADHREAALRFLRACERAETSPLLDEPAAGFAAPLFEDLEVESEEETLERLRAGLAGRYTLERELGRGGMARVYLARDERHGRLVALKLLRPELLPAGGAGRFRREIGFAARLSHPHILPLHDSGEAAGLLYYITPYIDGESLRSRLRRGGLPTPASAVRMLRDVARALAYAHRQGLVHRDIKPANILLSQDGDALVADFGVAMALVVAQGLGSPDDQEPADRSILGTPAYMAPEQVAGVQVDHRADLYALGVVAFELLTGRLPFEGRSGDERLAAQRFETPPRLGSLRPDLPESLGSLVDGLLAKSPVDRPQSASAVMDALDEVLASLSFARIRSREGGRRPFSGRRRALAVTLTALALVWAVARFAREPVVATGAELRGTTDAEAYELYLKGRHLTATRQRDGLVRALEYFDQAISRDPGFARAHAGAGDAWAFLGVFGQMPPEEAFPRARAAAERAIALDGLLVEAYATLAHVLFVYEWDWAAAEEALDRAIALDPGYPLVRMYRASLLHSLGRSEEALLELDAARKLDPLTPTALLTGRILVDTQRPDTAIRILEEQ
ncbi:MAG: protein kinase, partial [Gemmatimonadota bacterium]|nr:protein kinase [Gemmatimonadota bacterium]